MLMGVVTGTVRGVDIDMGLRDPHSESAFGILHSTMRIFSPMGLLVRTIFGIRCVLCSMRDADAKTVWEGRDRNVQG